MTDRSMQAIHLEQAVFELNNSIVGNQRLIDRLVVAMVAGGAALVGGPAGVGKFIAAESVARVFGLTPVVHHGAICSDETGQGDASRMTIVTDIDRAPEAHLHRLADEVGRSPERHIVATTTMADPAALPRRLRDVSLMYLEVPYPDSRTEFEMALRAGDGLRQVDRILRIEDLANLRHAARQLPISDATVRYAVGLVQATRDPEEAGLPNLAPLIGVGASPRASIAMVRAARGAALLAARDEVTTQDVYDVAYDVLLHRVEPSAAARADDLSARDLLVELLSRVPAEGPLVPSF